MCLIIGKVDGFIDEKNGSKYLVFDSPGEDKEVLKKCKELWDGVKNENQTISGGKEGQYGKDFMKIKFDTNDDLPLNKPLRLHMLTIVVLFLKKIIKFVHKYIWMNVCMSYKKDTVRKK